MQDRMPMDLSIEKMASITKPTLSKYGFNSSKHTKWNTIDHTPYKQRTANNSFSSVIMNELQMKLQELSDLNAKDNLEEEEVKLRYRSQP